MQQQTHYEKEGRKEGTYREILDINYGTMRTVDHHRNSWSFLSFLS